MVVSGIVDSISLLTPPIGKIYSLTTIHFREGSLKTSNHFTHKKGIDYTSRLSIEPITAGKIRGNVKFVAFWCVFLTKIKVDPESWCNKLSIKQLRMKKIPKDKFT